MKKNTPEWAKRGLIAGMSLYRSTFYIPTDELKILEQQALTHNVRMNTLLNEIFQLGLVRWSQLDAEEIRATFE